MSRHPSPSLVRETTTNPRSYSPPSHLWFLSPIPSTSCHLQVETEVLLLLKEVIHNEFAHKVGIECVVNDFGASKLQEKMGCGPQGQAGGVGESTGLRAPQYRPQ